MKFSTAYTEAAEKNDASDGKDRDSSYTATGLYQSDFGTYQITYEYSGNNGVQFKQIKPILPKAQMFNTKSSKFSKAFFNKLAEYNDMGLVSPNGQFHSTNGLSHPDWCQENYKNFNINFHPTKNMDYERVPEEDAWMDDNDQTALDAFKDAGWIRIKPNQGIELGYINQSNARVIKRILQEMAKQNAGRTLYVDVGGDVKNVSVSMTGRPDFSELN